jgi:hypothetical protein
MASIIQELYDSQIAVYVYSDREGSFAAELGQPACAVGEQMQTWVEVESWLFDNAIKRFPQTAFASEHRMHPGLLVIKHRHEQWPILQDIHDSGINFSVRTDGQSGFVGAIGWQTLDEVRLTNWAQAVKWIHSAARKHFKFHRSHLPLSAA